MGLWDKLTKGRSKALPVRRPDDTITVFDERGRELKVRREDWAQSVLVPELDKARNSPDRLCGVIVGALNDDFAEHVVDAAEQLARIDPDHERSAVILGIVRLKVGDLRGA